MRDRNEQVEGLSEPHELEVLLDRERVKLFTVKPPPRGAQESSRRRCDLKIRVPVTAGPHELGVTFLKKPSALLETERQPYQAHFNMYRHPRLQPAVYQVSITGPYDANGPGDTPSRRRIFVCAADGPGRGRRLRQSGSCPTLMRRAYRRPVTDEDLRRPLEFYRRGAGRGAASKPASRWR